MFMDSGPLKSHKPLQHLRVFAPQEPVFTPPSPREVAARGEWTVPASKELRFTGSLDSSCLFQGEGVEATVGYLRSRLEVRGLAVIGIQLVLKAARPEMARGVSTDRDQDQTGGWKKEPAETQKEGTERLLGTS